jgi:hypothetical protein
MLPTPAGEAFDDEAGSVTIAVVDVLESFGAHIGA